MPKMFFLYVGDDNLIELTDESDNTTYCSISSISNFIKKDSIVYIYDRIQDWYYVYSNIKDEIPTCCRLLWQTEQELGLNAKVFKKDILITKQYLNYFHYLNEIQHIEEITKSRFFKCLR